MAVTQSKAGAHNATIYVADPEVWQQAKQKAERNGRSISAVIGALLAQYVHVVEHRRPRAKHLPLRLHDGSEG